MRGLSTFAAAIAIATGAFGLASSATGQTGPYKAQLDQAKQARVSGDLGQSSLIVRGVLAKDPGNFRATYTKGLIELDQGQPGAAVSTLNGAVAGLNGKPAPDPSIYNTLGYALMNQGRLDDAAKAFQKGYAVKGSLPAASQQKLLNNMSLLYRLKGDQSSANTYLQQAAAAGSPQARLNMAKAAK
jgi:Flp pilus assembly protein TadD